MKNKHYIWIFALLGLTACSSEADSVMPGVVEEEPIQVLPSKNIPIQFGFSTEADTRADIHHYVHGATQKVIPKGEKVGVFGYFQGYDIWESSPQKADFFYNEPMTVEDPLSTETKTTYLTYSPLRFWPNGKDENGVEQMLSFYAYYPYVEDDAAATTLGLKPLKDYFNTGQGRFLFTCKDYASEQIDFMVTTLEKDHVRSSYLTGDKRVPMTFYHRLSRILININIDPATQTVTNPTTGDEEVVTKARVYDKIEQVKVLGVQKQATYYPMYMFERLEWNIPLNGDPLRLQGDVEIDQMPAKNANLVASPETALLLIPQRCEQKSHKIYIKLHYDGQGTDASAYKEFTFPLTDLWIGGRDYEYNFRVSETDDDLRDTTDFHGNAGIPEDGGTIN